MGNHVKGFTEIDVRYSNLVLILKVQRHRGAYHLRPFFALCYVMLCYIM